ALNIPHFALTAEKSRPHIEVMRIEEAGQKSYLIGGNTLRCLAARYDGYHFMKARQRTGQRIALYSSWLVFADAKSGLRFVEQFPHFGLANVANAVLRKRERFELRLKEKLATGYFNLEPHTAYSSLRRAREYIEINDALENLRADQWALDCLHENIAAIPEGIPVG
ncbi:hypothetical protein, partial [Heyndrickxia sporothermodurans]